MHPVQPQGSLEVQAWVLLLRVSPEPPVLFLHSRSNENTSWAAVDTESGLLCKALAVAPRVRKANNQRLLELLTQAMVTWEGSVRKWGSGMCAYQLFPGLREMPVINPLSVFILVEKKNQMLV